MAGLELFSYAASIIVLALAVVLGFTGKVRLEKGLVLVYLIIFTLYIILRWTKSGHPPVFGTFEETVIGSWTIMLVALLLDKRAELLRYVSLFTIIIMGYGLLFDKGHYPLIISEQSIWVYFHVIAAWLAFALYVIITVVSVKVISGRGLNYFSELRGLSAWIMGEGLVVAFFAQTLFFVIGSYYSSKLHGNLWTWDPVEYLFCVSWFLYGVSIHGKIFYKWELRRVAKWSLVSFVALMALYWGLVYVSWSTYHVFDTAKKVHMAD